MTRTARLLFALGLASVLIPTAIGSARAAEPPQGERAHELGWLCVNVSDVRISQISAFNKDSPSLSIWVPKTRFHIERAGSGEAGRLCVPAVVRLGEAPLPPETLVFERTVISGSVHRPSVAELVVTPESALLAEVTIEVIGLADQWTQRDDTLTFQSLRPIEFPPRVARGLLGDGEGPAPPEVFRALAAMQRFAEPCQPAVLDDAVAASIGRYDPKTGSVSARGIEPFVLDAGTKVSRCEGLALDTLMLAVARPATDTSQDEVQWFVIPRETRLTLLDQEGAPARRYTAQHPLGGYHVCRQPTWSTSVLTDIPLAGAWELVPGRAQWRQNLPGEPGAEGVLAGGASVTLLDYRDTWAVVSVELSGQRRIIAAPASAIAMPTGPGDGAQELDGGLCSVAGGQWRALKANAQSFKVSQDTPGAELAGLWLEIPMGTHLLQLCQDGALVGGKTIPGVPACEPIFVGGTQATESDRFVLVQYAGTYLGVRARDLRDKTTGEFELRSERPWFHRAGGVTEAPETGGWALSLGPSARLSFLRPDDHAWVVTIYLQRLAAHHVGFEGGISAGGDGYGTFLSVTGGVGGLLHRFEDSPIELRAAVLGQLDVRVSDGGGLSFGVVGQAQLRWVNDFAPVSLIVGLNVGYGGNFGDKAKGRLLLGLPIGLQVQLVEF